ncbi:MAG: hypothetical protein M3P43_15210 [Actinomycetota bacterium]|nr:hypothetical protein [Actinomycetota bacterium]
MWVTMMAFPLTEEQAARLAAGDCSDAVKGRYSVKVPKVDSYTIQVEGVALVPGPPCPSATWRLPGSSTA